MFGGGIDCSDRAMNTLSTLRMVSIVKERVSLTTVDWMGLKETRKSGADQSRESIERDRAFAERAAAIDRLRRLRTKTP